MQYKQILETMKLKLAAKLICIMWKNEKSNGHTTLLSITFLLMYIIWWEIFTIKSIQYLRLFSCNLIVILVYNIFVPNLSYKLSSFQMN